MATLYLMLGYPGAGKTTTAEVIRELTGALHLSSDKLRHELFDQPGFTQPEHDALYKELDARAEALLAQGRDVIYDANLNRYQHRWDKYQICARAGAKPVLVWVQTPKDLAKQRATAMHRLHLAPADETLSQLFDRIAGIIEEPVPDEPYTAIDGTKVTPQYVANCLGL
jgi:hypothetical protein